MNKLPNVYHPDEKVFSNSMNSYSNNKSVYGDVLNVAKEKVEGQLIDFFDKLNKSVEISLKDGGNLSGTVVSIQSDYILLSNGSYVNKDDILYLK